jgi:hypothetical protein
MAMRRFRVTAKEISKVAYTIELPDGTPEPVDLERWAEHIAVAEPAIVMSVDVVEVCAVDRLDGAVN